MESGVAIEVTGKRSVLGRHDRGDARGARRAHETEPSVAAAAVEQHRDEDDQPGTVTVGQRPQSRHARRCDRLDVHVGQRTRIDDAREIHQPSELGQQPAKDEVSHFCPRPPELAQMGRHHVRRLSGVQPQLARRRGQIRRAHEIARRVVAAHAVMNPLARAQHHDHQVGARAFVKQAAQPVVPVVVVRLLDDEPPRVPLRRQRLAHAIELDVLLEQRVADEQHVAAAAVVGANRPGKPILVGRAPLDPADAIERPARGALCGDRNQQAAGDQQPCIPHGPTCPTRPFRTGSR